MADLRYSSNADEIRSYIKTLLEDGHVHNRREIGDYVRSTPNGHTFTEGMITGAIKSLVENQSEQYENFKRGWYRKKSSGKTEEAAPKVNENLDVISQRVNAILSETVAKLKEALTFNLLDLKEIDRSKIDKVSELINTINSYRGKI